MNKTKSLIDQSLNDNYSSLVLFLIKIKLLLVKKSTSQINKSWNLTTFSKLKSKKIGYHLVPNWFNPFTWIFVFFLLLTVLLLAVGQTSLHFIRNFVNLFDLIIVDNFCHSDEEIIIELNENEN